MAVKYCEGQKSIKLSICLEGEIENFDSFKEILVQVNKAALAKTDKTFSVFFTAVNPQPRKVLVL